jgi:8-oxo-dGTP pyrophosphatase MutT (NUDIX family)
MQVNSKWSRFIHENDSETAGIVVCVDDNDNFLIIRRSNIDEREGQWTIPGGHIDDKDKSIEAGALRELEEETNLTCSRANLVFLEEAKPDKFYFWAKEWSGDVDVDIPNPETGLVEHDAYKWATIGEIKDIDNTEIPIYLLEKVLDMSKNAK